MFGFLKKKKKEVVEIKEIKGSAEEIQTYVFALIVKNLEEMVKQKELLKEKSLPSEIIKKAEKLKRLGFSNCKDVRKYNDLEKGVQEIKDQNEEILKENKRRIKFLKLYLELQKKTDYQALLVDFKDFEEIMDKYGLVCGPLSHYKGDIPEEQIEVIEEIENNLWKLDYDINTLYYIDKITIENHVAEVRNSLKKEVKKVFTKFPLIECNDVDDYLLRNYVVKNRLLELSETVRRLKDRMIFSVELDSTPNKLFICAPASEMLKAPKIEVNFIPDDPMICAKTDLGIIIFTAWGKEGNDSLLEKYKEFNKKVKEFIEKKAK